MTWHSIVPPAADLPNMPTNICTAGIFAAGVFAGPHHMKNDV